MINRMLVLSFEGAPAAWAMFASDIRARILRYGDDCATCLQVWSIQPANSMDPGQDITERFAIEWSKEFDFRDSPSSSEAMASFPGFVQEAAGAHLLALWTNARSQARGAA